MSASVRERLSLEEIEARICQVVEDELALQRGEVTLESRLLRDLNVDSLDAVELLMAVEDEFGVSLPEDVGEPAYKQIFTRHHFRMRDFAELVYMRQGVDPPARTWFGRKREAPEARREFASFTQLGGSIGEDEYRRGELHEKLSTGRGKVRQFRRATDGMVCVELPEAEVEVGADGKMEDEGPAHIVPLNRFLVDVEPVSTSAYCRFLNSIGEVPRETLEEWFLCTPRDKRREHELVRRTDAGWEPVAGTERFPMILVTWYGANAYSLWANRRDWRRYRDDEGSCLPTEAQWEYAAHGAERRTWPWGEWEPTPDLMRFGRHEAGRTYEPRNMPLAEVNEQLGVSPFGLRHTAGNVWQWCRDSYCAKFYQTPLAAERDAICREPTGVKVERGGSWIGPAFLCRTTYRRGRTPGARGRCLGFRCVGEAK